MDVWTEAKQQLSLQMTPGTFNQWIKPTVSERRQSELFIISPNPLGVEWLESRLKTTVQRTVDSLEAGLTITFLAQDTPLPAIIEVTGGYTNPYTQTVNPEKVEVFTQYFRRVWRPVLKPLLSELVRELRQRCYHGKGDDRHKRDVAETTYEELAGALGVHKNTIYNSLKQDKNGVFLSNPHLHLFIVKMEVLTRYDKKKKKVINDKTRFTIALDEPIYSEPSNHKNCD